MKIRTQVVMAFCSGFFWFVLYAWSNVGAWICNGLFLWPPRKVVEGSKTYAEIVQRITGFGWNGQLLVLALIAGGFLYFATRKKREKKSRFTKTSAILTCCSAIFWLLLVVWSGVESIYYDKGRISAWDEEVIEYPMTYAELIKSKTGQTLGGQMFFIAILAGGFQYLAMRKRNHKPTNSLDHAKRKVGSAESRESRREVGGK